MADELEAERLADICVGQSGVEFGGGEWRVCRLNWSEPLPLTVIVSKPAQPTSCLKTHAAEPVLASTRECPQNDRVEFNELMIVVDQPQMLLQFDAGQDYDSFAGFTMRERCHGLLAVHALPGWEASLLGTGPFHLRNFGQMKMEQWVMLP